jgi:transcriptional regulator with XRE-family HTH domain
MQFVQDTAERLKDFMDRKGLTQMALARHAGVSQATVSRALAGFALRKGPARARLFSYAGIKAQRRYSRSRRARLVYEAFEENWDGTASHARAIVKIIEALGELRPKGTKTA